MARWNETIDVKKFFAEKGEDVFEENRDGIVAALKTSRWYKNFVERPCEPSLHICVEELEEAEDPYDFDYYWGLLYDLADRDRVWIETF